MRSELTEDEVDTVIANIPPSARRWCPASCGLAPGDDPRILEWFGCACTGCIAGDLTWDEFSAWRLRESQREPTAYVVSADPPEVAPPTLAERLAEFKNRKRPSAC